MHSTDSSLKCASPRFACKTRMELWWRQRGIHFEHCLVQDHSAYGRIEAKIRMVHQSLVRSNNKVAKMCTMEWQTLAWPSLSRGTSTTSLLDIYSTDIGHLPQVLTPNSLEFNTASERAPSGLFTILTWEGGEMKIKANLSQSWSLGWAWQCIESHPA